MNHFSIQCNTTADNQFGPVVPCVDFDFSLAFEQSVFIIGTSSLLLLLFPFRFIQLYAASIKTFATPLQHIKIGLSVIIIALQLASLVLWTKTSDIKYAVAAGTLDLAGAIAVSVLVVMEHMRSIRPSTITAVYLLSTIIGNSVQLRTLWLRGYASTLSQLLSAVLAFKVSLLVADAWPKQKYLRAVPTGYGPEETSSILTRSVFWWLNSLFWHGSKNVLSSEDLFPLDQQLRSSRLRDLAVLSWKKSSLKGKYSFANLIIVCLWGPMAATIVPRAACIGFTYAQTFLITAAIKYLEEPTQLKNQNHAYGLIGAAILIYFGRTISDVLSVHKMVRVTTSFRGIACSIIYERLMSTKADGDQMEVVPLISTDVDRLVSSIGQLIGVWALVVEVGIGVSLLWRQLGPISIAPLFVVILCFGGQTLVSKLIPAKQKVWMEAIGRRIKFTSSLLRSMKSVKLAGLVELTGNFLQNERVRELKLASKARWLMVWQNVVANTPSLLSGLATFVAYAINSQVKHTASLSTSQAFTSLALIMLLTGPATQLLQLFPSVIATKPCYDRIQKFLLAATIDDSRRFQTDSEGLIYGNSHILQDRPLLCVTNLRLDVPFLCEGRPISFSIHPGTVWMVSGAVGSGKSTLLKSILGEISAKEGTIDLQSKFIGYCAQTPWLQNNSIKKNIIGRNLDDDAWYRHVIHTCNLEPDISQMPNGHDTQVGDRGLSVSGGQKHRIWALARALYSRCPLLVLDDLFSALDRKTQIVIAKRLFSADGHVKKYRCGVIFASHAVFLAQFVNFVLELDSGACLAFSGSGSEWITEKGHVLEKDTVDEEDAPFPSKSEPMPKSNPFELEQSEKDKKEQLKRRVGDLSLWKYYAKSIGMGHILQLALFTLVYVLGSNFPQLWLKKSTEHSAPPVQVFIGVYTGICILTITAFGTMIAQTLIRITPKTAIGLHHVLIQATFNAPMSFFETTDTSKILNRFSQDMNLIEMALPIAAWLLYQTLTTCLVQLILISMGSSYLAVTIPVTIFAVYLIQKFYLRTSRQIRLLDLEAKSPMYQQFTETLEGLPTIRAFGWQEKFEEEALNRLDFSQKPYYLMQCIQRWLTLVLDLTISVLAVVLVTMALCIPNSSNPGAIGVALSTLLGFNMSLQQVILNWTQAETSIGSLARIKSFSEDTPNENLNPNSVVLDNSWPSGEIEVEGLTVVYSNGSVALDDVSFKIGAGEKFGICGRTGSGKSTLLAIFLRLLDPTTGTIRIDGYDIGIVPRNTLRNRVLCLPQDPLLFPGTFRFNLDPEDHTKSVTEMGSVLKKLKLWDLIQKLGGLDAYMTPESLSHGEQQLLVLSRAILKKRTSSVQRSILILDEATSNLDASSELAIHEAIQEEFKNDTVISVAHRLDTLKDMDMVLLLENGKIAKIGQPAEVIPSSSQC